MNLARCLTCRLWQAPPGGALATVSVGECHCGPPQVQIIPLPNVLGKMELQNVSIWPPKRSDDWCGQHRALKAGD